MVAHGSLCAEMNGYTCQITALDVRQAVETNLKGQKFKLVDFQSNAASSEPLGFMGEHVRIVVNALTDVNNQELRLQYFAKKIPTQVVAHRKYAEATRAFYKEIELYKSLFDEIESAISIERRNVVKWRPACFYARNWDLLICEDLSTQGYYMLPERSFFPIENVQASIKTLARMHAGSIIFEGKLKNGQCETRAHKRSGKNITIRDLYSHLIFESECTDKAGHPGHSFWEAGINGQVAVLDELDNYTREQKDKIKLKFSHVIRQIYRMLEPSDKFRNVMIHADLWGNNVMFQNDEGGKVKGAILVDFQMTRFAPPAQDLLMFLHAVQNRHFRVAHEAALLELYYNCLASELAAEGFDIHNELPRQQFEDSCHYYKRYAVLNQIIMTQLTITPPKICGKIVPSSKDYDRIMYHDRSDILVQSFREDDLCRERATESIVEIVDTFNLL